MPDGGEDQGALTARVAGSIGDIAAADWDACAGATNGDKPANPFTRHAFLHALEESGSVGTETGWLPQHLLLEDSSGRLVGAAPMYMKAHSHGEYVFDFGWAEAFERAGGRYYPKLQVAVPFSPVTGPRLLARPGAEKDHVQAALARALISMASRSPVSSLHVTFHEASESTALAEAGFIARRGFQYHWTNRGYGAFEDFLCALASRKRKAIRKERRAAQDAGVTIETLSGDAITKSHWDAFHGFYMDTVGRKWGYPYLTRAFFSLIGRTMPESVVLVLASDACGAPVAGALNFLGPDALFGRYWGCGAEYKFLHFEMCYYRAIEFAIVNGLARVEAGAQGPHKIQRGYLPCPTLSAHWIRDPGLAAAVETFLEDERASIDGEMRALAAGSPYAKSGPG